MLPTRSIRLRAIRMSYLARLTLTPKHGPSAATVRIWCPCSVKLTGRFSVGHRHPVAKSAIAGGCVGLHDIVGMGLGIAAGTVPMMLLRRLRRG